MTREKYDPESKYGFEIIVINALPEEIEQSLGFMPEFSVRGNTAICQVDGTDDLFQIYFMQQEFLNLEDGYVAMLILSIMSSIDEKTGDPDPHMDMNFRSLGSDVSPGIVGIALNEQFERIMAILHG